jgi:hypothetical protein
VRWRVSSRAGPEQRNHSSASILSGLRSILALPALGFNVSIFNLSQIPRESDEVPRVPDQGCSLLGSDRASIR